MSFIKTPTRRFPNNAALARGTRVIMTAGYLAAAGSTDVELGTMERGSLATESEASVLLRTAEGTSEFVASGAITAFNPFYAASSGKVASSGTILLGIAMEAAAANNDRIEGLRRQETSDSAASGGTTAAAFKVDSDSTTPKIELAAQTGGTGDFKATIKPPATLTADRIYTLPGDFAGTVKSDYTFPATPAADSGAGSSIPVGVSQVAVGTVTNDANDWIVLPAIASVPIGFTIWIAANAGTNFEMRTPASSNTKINDVDSDGTQEYLCTDTDMIVVTKRTTTGWVAQSLTKLGAVRTAVVPD